MTVQSSPSRSQQSYRHEAFLYHEPDDFTAGLAPFVLEGLAAGEPVMAALTPEHRNWLEESLNGKAQDVTFVDMSQLGRNPARIIPAWQRFLDENDGRPVRGIGEPIWPGRRPEELLECQLHEALLNVAVDPEIPFWLICPYDVERLDETVVEEAHRSHPVIVEADSYSGSVRYGGRAHVDSLFSSDLVELSDEPILATFESGNVDRLLAYLRLELHVAGLEPERAALLASTVQRLAVSALSRGAAEGTLRIWNQPHAVICDVVDEVTVSDLLHGRRPPFGDDHDGLWRANHESDLVQLRSTPAGTTVRVHAFR
jgi:hypothetical protein